MDAKEIDEKLKEIEFFQSEFERIYMNRSWFIKIFTTKKARKLLYEADKKLKEFTVYN
jgi:hypothetical protein